jgi:electron-transferring-flavoprotein dehydrogenase
VEKGAREAENARNGFQDGFIKGVLGMGLAGLTRGRLALKAHLRPACQQLAPATLGAKPEKVAELTQAAQAGGRPLHDALMSERGWPEIPFDGRLLVTHQDALLMGGKVQAAAGFADHVLFRNPAVCKTCIEKTCVAMCSGQAITLGPDGLPAFEREKCVHCGGCLWNCGHSPDGEHSNIEFRAGSGGLHSAEN